MKRYGFLSFALVLLVLSGCAPITDLMSKDKEYQKQNKELAKHVISIDPDGNLKPIGCDGDAECEKNYLDSIIYEIRAYQDKQQQDGKDSEVLLFVHGGLNNEDDSIVRARSLMNHVKDDVYPVFVIWDSRGLATYQDHLLRIRQGEESQYKAISYLSSPFYLLTDIGNSIVNAPKSWFITGEHMRGATMKKNDNLNDETCALRREKISVVDPGKTGDLPSNFYRRLRWILSSPIKALTTPFAYTMPKPAWNIMLRRTNTLFYTPGDLKKKAEPCTAESKKEYADPPPKRQIGSGALYSFLEKLNLPEIKITLVGHSMGAIIVNKIVLLEPKLPYKNIVHLASADSINNLFNIITPYIAYDIENKKKENEKCKESDQSSDCNEQAVQFYSLMLHPDNENREEAWGGIVPSGSLLTWIDEMYTTPETVMDRRSGRWDNIKRAIPYLPAKVKENMHFKIFGIDSKQDEQCEQCRADKDCYCPMTVPKKHGDFSHMRFWDEKTWK